MAKRIVNTSKNTIFAVYLFLDEKLCMFCRRLLYKNSIVRTQGTIQRLSFSHWKRDLQNDFEKKMQLLDQQTLQYLSFHNSSITNKS